MDAPGMLSHTPERFSIVAHNSRPFLIIWILILHLFSSPYFNLKSLFTDSSLYAHYVFKAFDVNCNGAISFRDHIVTLSTLLRGSVYERLKWTFKLYDLNGDGCISRGELAEVVQAVHELMGKRIAEDDKKTRDQVRFMTIKTTNRWLTFDLLPFCSNLGRSGIQKARPKPRRRHHYWGISGGVPQGRSDNKISRNVRQRALMTIERNANENKL